jgi:hypothetical protein
MIKLAKKIHDVQTYEHTGLHVYIFFYLFKIKNEKENVKTCLCINNNSSFREKGKLSVFLINQCITIANCLKIKEGKCTTVFKKYKENGGSRAGLKWSGGGGVNEVLGCCQNLIFIFFTRFCSLFKNNNV